MAWPSERGEVEEDREIEMLEDRQMDMVACHEKEQKQRSKFGKD